jgi:D-amino-acid oxidase
MTLWDDPKVVPIKGQLAMLPPNDTYFHVPTTSLLVGLEVGVNDETVDKSVCQRLVDHIASLLGQGPVRLSRLWISISTHPDHALVVNPEHPRGLKFSGMAL